MKSKLIITTALVATFAGAGAFAQVGKGAVDAAKAAAKAKSGTKSEIEKALEREIPEFGGLKEESKARLLEALKTVRAVEQLGISKAYSKTTDAGRLSILALLKLAETGNPDVRLVVTYISELGKSQVAPGSESERVFFKLTEGAKELPGLMDKQVAAEEGAVKEGADKLAGSYRELVEKSLQQLSEKPANPRQSNDPLAIAIRLLGTDRVAKLLKCKW